MLGAGESVEDVDSGSGDGDLGGAVHEIPPELVGSGWPKRPGLDTRRLNGRRFDGAERRAAREPAVPELPNPDQQRWRASESSGAVAAATSWVVAQAEDQQCAAAAAPAALWH